MFLLAAVAKRIYIGGKLKQLMKPPPHQDFIRSNATLMSFTNSN